MTQTQLQEKYASPARQRALASAISSHFSFALKSNPALFERVGDAAQKALEEGKTLRKCMDIATALYKEETK